MKVTILAVAVPLVVVQSVGAIQAHKKVSTRCVPGEPHVLVANAHAVVYEGPSDGNPGEIDACAYGYRRSYALGRVPYGSSSGGGGVARETLAGTAVAYEVFDSFGSEESGSSTELVVVRNLRNGRVLHRVPTGVSARPSQVGNIGIGRTTGLVVKSDGAVAWIVATGEELPNGEERGTFQVHAVDSTGGRVLASGGNVDPSSLALAGSRVYWMQGGVPESAVLN
jgi:hypothetical protein